MKLPRDSTRTYLFLAVTAILVACTILAACGGLASDPTGSTTQPLGSLTISGVVADSSGNPVGGVKIALNGSAQASTFSDFSQGAYSFSVNPGSYSLTPSGGCTSFQPSVVNLNNLTASAKVNFLGTGDNIIMNCQATNTSGGTSGSLTVSGHVTSGGNPVAGVKVAFNGSSQGFRVTDTTGAYTFLANPGSYSLNPSGACNAFTPSVANLNNLTTNKTQDFQGSGHCPPAPLTFCPLLNTEFTGLSGGPACATVTTTNCPDAVGTWGTNIAIDFAIAISSDCRFGQWANLLTSDDVILYLDDLTSFTLYFFGCPFVGTNAGPLSFALIPRKLQSRVFTTADLNGLSATYAAAVAQALSDNGSPPLTGAQSASVNATLAYLQTTVPGTITSPNFTFSTCPDAGH
jgi:Carboxypeptidase regulatory-like domain